MIVGFQVPAARVAALAGTSIRGSATLRSVVLATGAGLAILMLTATGATGVRADDGAGYSMPFLERSLNKTIIHQGTRSQTLGIGRGTRHIYVPDRRGAERTHRPHRERGERGTEARERSRGAR